MRRLVLGAAVVGALLLAGATRADAHDPIILTDAQTTPAAGPRLPDGTISFALYGTLAGGADARGFRADLRAGQRLELTLLIPDLEPERALDDASLPLLTVVAPDGATTEHRPDRREPFAESFSRTDYVRLVEIAEPVTTTGEYAVTVTGAAPARFTVAIGSIERFGTPVDDVPNRDEGVAGVQRWYATPPTPTPTPTVAGPATPTSSGAPAATSAPLPAVAATSAPTGVVSPTTSAATVATTTAAGAPTADDGGGTGAVRLVVVGGAIGVAAGAMLAVRTRRSRRSRP